MLEIEEILEKIYYIQFYMKLTFIQHFYILPTILKECDFYEICKNLLLLCNTENRSSIQNIIKRILIPFLPNDSTNLFKYLLNKIEIKEYI